MLFESLRAWFSPPRLILCCFIVATAMCYAITQTKLNDGTCKVLTYNGGDCSGSVVNSGQAFPVDFISSLCVLGPTFSVLLKGGQTPFSDGASVTYDAVFYGNGACAGKGTALKLVDGDCVQPALFKSNPVGTGGSAELSCSLWSTSTAISFLLLLPLAVAVGAALALYGPWSRWCANCSLRRRAG